MTASWPFRAARASDVHPLSALASMAAPWMRRRSTMETWPRWDAIASGVNPLSVLAQQALFDCKAHLGLLPQQCYKPKHGTCDAQEFELKKCLAFLYNERDARVLYNAKSPRDERVWLQTVVSKSSSSVSMCSATSKAAPVLCVLQRGRRDRHPPTALTQAP
jgi:hypothetical protein